MKNQPKATFATFHVKLLKVDGSNEETLALEMASGGKPVEASKVLGSRPMALGSMS